jgi:hypothetical protein
MKRTADMCANLSFNEGKGDLRASPMLRAGKRHKGGIIKPRKSNKARTQRWALKAKAKWQAKRGPLKYSDKYIQRQQWRLGQRATRRAARVDKLEALREREIDKMQTEERIYNEQILESAEKALRPKHSEEAGVYYGPSGGLEKRGKLHVPWPLPAMDISFNEDLMQEDSDSDSDDEVEEEEQQQQQQQPQQPPRRQSARAVSRN